MHFAPKDNVNVGRLPSAGVHAYASGGLTRSDAVSDITSGFAVIMLHKVLVFRIDKKTDGMLLKHAVRHYRDKVMFDCRHAYLAMIFSTFEPVRRM